MSKLTKCSPGVGNYMKYRKEKFDKSSVVEMPINTDNGSAEVITIDDYENDIESNDLT